MSGSGCRALVASLVLLAGASVASSARAAPNPRKVASLRSYNNFGPSELVVSGGKVFFALDDGPGGTYHGTELWVSDGTAAGTRMLKDIVPGESSSMPSSFIALGSTVFFNAKGAGLTRELWKTDGTEAGTVPVGNLRATDRWYDRQVLGGKLFLDGSEQTAAGSNWELWMTDGTTTSLVADLEPGGASTPTDVTVQNGKLYFIASVSGHNGALWVTDASGGAPVRLLDGASAAPWDRSIESMGGFAYFGSREMALYRTDGTVAGTTLVKGGFANAYPPDNMHALPSGRLLFRGFDAAHGGELWSSDGTDAGTSLLKDIEPGTGTSLPNLGSGAVYKGALYFGADDGASGEELWRSDGTAGGTVMLKDIAPGVASSSARFVTVVGDRLLFVATDPAHGAELWESDGTEAGSQVVDLRPGPSSSRPRALTVTGNSAYFTAEGADGPELWIYDGPPVTPTVPDGGVPLADAGATDDGGHAIGNDGGAPSEAGPGVASNETGCGCRTAGSPGAVTFGGLGALVAALAAAMFRRVRSRLGR